ncbi:zinc finger protein [Macleaya cordata]|uniref:Protein FAR1-RELATED SEQUENCE n=1 Tax=Macleaya cordata TaxID=56857 RepID=A0A200PWC1_MACCD|nr:zinc finger protein [Macleaya cordata]
MDGGEDCNLQGFATDSHPPLSQQEIDDPSISCPTGDRDVEGDSLPLSNSLEKNNAIDGDTEMTPTSGMTFNSYDEAWDFYNRHAMQKGFGTKEGFKESKEGALYRRPNIRVGCKAHMRIKLLESKKWEDEVYGMASCSKSLPKADGPLITYSVKERITGKTGQSLDPKVYEVLYNIIEVQVRCTCRLFEYKGILCKHALCVLNEFVDEIPSQYILSRWRKDFKRKYILNHGSNDTDVRNPVQRYDVLYQNAIQIVDEGAISESSYNFVLQGLQDLKKKVQSINSVSSILRS